jgi:eukaryotic translation initiation factor 2C
VGAVVAVVIGTYLYSSVSTHPYPERAIRMLIQFHIPRPADEPIAPNPSREVEKAEDAIVRNKELSSKSLTTTDKPPFPSRPGYGNVGRSIVLRTNYFHVIPKEQQLLHRYVVQFSPVASSPRRERRLFTLLFESPIFEAVRNSVATDYSSIIISPERLPLPPDGEAERFVITYLDADEDAPRPNAVEHTVFLQASGTLNVADLMRYLSSTAKDARYERLEEMTQALNIIMTRHANTTAGVISLSGNKFFPIIKDQTSLDGGLVFIRGYYTSVRRATLRVLLNLNVCNAAFYQPISLFDLISKHRHQLQLDSSDSGWSKVEQFIGKVRVETNYLRNRAGERVRRFKTVLGFSHEGQSRYGNSRQVKFDSEYGTINVEAFFKKSEYY